MDDIKLFKKSIDAERIDLAKLGWTECRSDKKILSYIRGYIWRSYGLRIKSPLDWIIFCMINDALGEDTKNKNNYHVKGVINGITKIGSDTTE